MSRLLRCLVSLSLAVVTLHFGRLLSANEYRCSAWKHLFQPLLNISLGNAVLVRHSLSKSARTSLAAAHPYSKHTTRMCAIAKVGLEEHACD